MSLRGSVNRRTGKTTPRQKPKTHWGKKSTSRGSAAAAKAGKARPKSSTKA